MVFAPMRHRPLGLGAGPFNKLLPLQSVGSSLDIGASLEDFIERIFVAEQHAVLKHLRIIRRQCIESGAGWNEPQPAGDGGRVIDTAAVGGVLYEEHGLVARNGEPEFAICQRVLHDTGVIQPRDIAPVPRQAIAPALSTKAEYMHGGRFLPKRAFGAHDRRTRGGKDDAGRERRRVACDGPRFAGLAGRARSELGDDRGPDKPVIVEHRVVIDMKAFAFGAQAGRETVSGQAARSTVGSACSRTQTARRLRIALVQCFSWLRVGGSASSPAAPTRSGAKARIS